MLVYLRDGSDWTCFRVTMMVPEFYLTVTRPRKESFDLRIPRPRGGRFIYH